jgi:two-component system, cell cycle sensor histidine kinase and response regulator CckA
MERIDCSSTPGPTVLLVDDEELLRTLLSRILLDAGFMVAEAANGRAALDVAARLDGALSLVVTDIHMPVMTGPEFVREFRPRFPGIPVLYMTGRTVPNPEEGLGADLLQKPFTVEAFLVLVRRLLGGER